MAEETTFNCSSGNEIFLWNLYLVTQVSQPNQNCKKPALSPSPYESSSLLCFLCFFLALLSAYYVFWFFFYLILTSYWLNWVLFSYKKVIVTESLKLRRKNYLKDCNDFSFLLKLQLWSLLMIVQNKYIVFSICCGILYSFFHPLHITFILPEENMF